ncbi:MAG: hypothetical protein AB1505_03515 [Candidatus Latescibacterota bacterium]
MAAPRGAKTEMIENAVASFPADFCVADVMGACPSVSVDLVRRVLKQMRAAGRVRCLGRGRAARWRTVG